MKNQPGTMKNHENRPGTIKNQPSLSKNVTDAGSQLTFEMFRSSEIILNHSEIILNSHVRLKLDQGSLSIRRFIVT